MSGETVAVVGGGAWGTALAIHLASIGRRVGLWIYEEDLVERMRKRRDNPVYLPGIEIPDSVRPDADLPSAVSGADLVVVAVPSAHARSVHRTLVPWVPRSVPVVVTAKGIEAGTLALPIEVARQEHGDDRRLAVLSGPSFAEEVARGLPTAVVIASDDAALTLSLRDLVAGRSLRVYANHDPIGVQVAGALKNVIAIAAGLAEALGVGRNALAALITRGLAEIQRLGVAMGGDPATFSGLAGLGDLVLTCTGDLSRNRRTGLALGRGERLADLVARSPHVAEGVTTAGSARDLARKLGVELPIVDEVWRVLYDEGSPREAVDRLLGRPLGSEERWRTEPPR